MGDPPPEYHMCIELDAQGDDSTMTIFEKGASFANLIGRLTTLELVGPTRSVDLHRYTQIPGGCDRCTKFRNEANSSHSVDAAPRRTAEECSFRQGLDFEGYDIA
jgi:hypothetical protein